jgi:two-component system NarL family sensor kinase
MMEAMSTPARRTTLAAATLFALAVVEVAAAAALGAASGVGFEALADSYVVTNAVIGLTLAVAGWPIAWQRPENPIGWLLLAGGLCYATSGAGFAALGYAAEQGWGGAGWVLVASVAMYSWPWAIGLCLPMTLLLFPDGRPPTPRWRWTLVAAGLFGLLFVFTIAGGPGELPPIAGDLEYATIPGVQGLGGPVGLAGAVLAPLVFGSAVAGLIVRYRRGSEQVRRQLLWPVLALLVVLVGMSLPDLFGVLGFAGLALVPLSITVAILRHQLLDIRLVVSRSVLYLLLTAAVVGAYLGAVTLLDTALRRQVGLGSSVVATLLVAVAFNPVRVWLQRLVDRAFYGARQDPVRAVAEVGARLGDVGAVTGTGLSGVLAALCQVLRLPWAAVVVDAQEVASHGEPPPARHAIALRQGDDVIGELVVGLRAGESRLATADERVLALLAAPIAVAVHATTLSRELTESREHLITAREEERRRLRRDLHDGLGPALTGVILKADAARRLTPTDAGRAVALLAELQVETTAAIDDVRRLVYDLRPPTLDGLGLVGSLQEQALRLNRRADGSPLQITVEVPETLVELPAAVEVAAYRIATEALTNITRHSTATAATVTLETARTGLRLRIRDDGTSPNGAWRPGVGLTSMRERAEELGGSCTADHDGSGGLVTVHIPLRERP